MRGMRALANVMKMNKTITQIDLDDKPRIRIVSFVRYLYTYVLQFHFMFVSLISLSPYLF